MATPWRSVDTLVLCKDPLPFGERTMIEVALLHPDVHLEAASSDAAEALSGSEVGETKH